MPTPSPSRRVRSPDATAEVKRLLPWLGAVLVLWTAGVLLQRHRAPAPTAALSPWQVSFRALPPAQQRLYRAVREGIFEAENVRAETKQWPAVEALAAEGLPPFAADPLTPPLSWELRQQGVYAAYVGRPPAEGEGLRWLILFIEPDPNALKAANEAPPPVDEEHHTLPDGTALHVQVWTQPASQALPAGVPAFPVAEGWTQRVGQGP